MKKSCVNFKAKERIVVEVIDGARTTKIGSFTRPITDMPQGGGVDHRLVSHARLVAMEDQAYRDKDEEAYSMQRTLRPLYEKPYQSSRV